MKKIIIIGGLFFLFTQSTSGITLRILKRPQNNNNNNSYTILQPSLSYCSTNAVFHNLPNFIEQTKRSADPKENIKNLKQVDYYLEEIQKQIPKIHRKCIYQKLNGIQELIR